MERVFHSVKRLIILLCVTATGCVATNAARVLTPTQQAEVDRHTLGSLENPVRASGKSGRETYLASLRCWDGEPPAVLSRGRASRGQTSPYGTRAGMYLLSCALEPAFLPDGEPDNISTRYNMGLVYIDEHHKGYVERRAAGNLSLELPIGT